MNDALSAEDLPVLLTDARSGKLTVAFLADIP
jgi:hypothetical protein